ncbi:MAG: hypothetical protein JNL43_08340 [Flavobacteriales bacterium]|nr:hypothetical protein [Flavobacteriales bacterium]
MSVLRVFILLWVQAFVFGPELMKLPMLFLHYEEHCETDGALDLGTFLKLHYADTDHEGSDRSSHGDLPFHHHHGTATDQCGLKVWMSDAAAPVSIAERPASRPQPSHSDEAVLPGHARALLQPPKGLV